MANLSLLCWFNKYEEEATVQTVYSLNWLESNWRHFIIAYQVLWFYWII